MSTGDQAQAGQQAGRYAGAAAPPQVSQEQPKSKRLLLCNNSREGEAKVLEGGWVDPPPPPTRER